MWRAVWALVAAIVAASVVAVPEPAGSDDKKKKGKKPELSVRATPRFSFSPATVLFTAELKGGDDMDY